MARRLSSSMHRTPGRHAVLALVRLALSLSLLLGFLPRALDHHWAERLPWHTHLAGDSILGHRHPYATAHAHDATWSPGGEADDPGRVVVSFHDDGAGSGLAPTLPLLSEEPTPTAPLLGRISSAPGGGPRPAGVMPGVPHPPPIRFG